MSAGTAPNTAYSIPVSSGIFGHQKRIGAALWVFCWLINKTTKEVPAVGGKVDGLVYGGQPVALAAIASDMEEMSQRSVRLHLDQLAEAGYIRKIDHGNGRPNGYAVINSKRFYRPKKIPDQRHQTAAKSCQGTAAKSCQDRGQIMSGPRQDPATVDKEVNIQSKNKVEEEDANAPISPEMVAKAVLDDLSLSGKELYRILIDICRSELKRGELPDVLRDNLVSAWTDYSRAQRESRFTQFVQKPRNFFGEGTWKSRTLWPWKNSTDPFSALPGGRAYDSVEAQLAKLGAPLGAA
jgi:DNA-binding transcriptional ArsR family regulator